MNGHLVGSVLPPDALGSSEVVMQYEILKVSLTGLLCLGLGCSSAGDGQMQLPQLGGGGNLPVGGGTIAMGTGGLGVTVGTGGSLSLTGTGGLQSGAGDMGSGGAVTTGGVTAMTGGSVVPVTGGVTPTGGVATGGSVGGTGGTVVAPGEVQLPTLMGSCPQLTSQGTYQFGNSASVRNMAVDIYVDPSAQSKPDPGGPLILYFHATGANPSEVHSGFGDTAIKQVTDAGGLVASFTTTPCPGCTSTDDLVWFAEDDYIMDDVVACAVQQAKIDTKRIHVLGWSAGALHSTHVALARSNYIASFISYSGGSYLLPTDIQNPNNHVAGILSYGAQGVDTVILDFHQQSISWYDTYNAMGWYCMMCDHEQGHMIPSDLAPHAYKFFMDHPFEVDPEPYAGGVPAEFPSYCKNMP